MARKMTEWPSKRGPITKIMPSDGCIGDTAPLAVGKWYDFHEFGWYMGNVGPNTFFDIPNCKVFRQVPRCAARAPNLSGGFVNRRDFARVGFRATLPG